MSSRTRRRFLQHLGVASVVGATASTSATATSSSGKVVFVYDDGPATDYDVFQLHREAGVPGCSAVISERLGEDGWLSPSQLREMESGGWEIMSHTKNHRALNEIPLTADVQAGDDRLPVRATRHATIPGDELVVSDDHGEETVTVTGSEQADDESYLTLEEPVENEYRVDADAGERYTDEIVETALEASKQTIEATGVTVSNLVVPYGRYGEHAQEVAPQLYDAVANSSHRDTVNSLAAPAPYRLKRRYFKPDEMTESELATYLDSVTEQNALGILAGHTQYESFSKDRLRTAIQMVEDRGIEVVTLREALVDAGVVEPTTTETTTATTTTTETNATTEATATTTSASSTTSAASTPGFGLLAGVAGASLGVLAKYLQNE